MRTASRGCGVGCGPGKAWPAPDPLCELSESKAKGGRLFLVGVDTVKATLMDRLARGRSLRFSHALEAAYYDQLASERKVVRYQRGQPVWRFERKPGMRAEALNNCLVYAWAARHMLTLPLDQRATDLARATPASQPLSSVASTWV